MHECPECGFACDCDGEDLWQPAPAICECAFRDNTDPDPQFVYVPEEDEE